MRRVAGKGLVVGAAIALTFMAVFVQALAGPGRALACSCMEPMPTLADVAQEPNTVVIAGTIGPQQPERTPVEVDTWFHGPGPTNIVWLSFGTQMMTSCDPVVTAGERRLMVLHRDPQGVFTVNPCVTSGVIGTDAGDAALAEANALFAAATPPPVEPTEPPPVVAPPPTEVDAARIYVVGAIVAALLVFAVVGFVALRRRPSA